VTTAQRKLASCHAQASIAGENGLGERDVLRIFRDFVNGNRCRSFHPTRFLQLQRRERSEMKNPQSTPTIS
jgi:hypothetical protein